MTFELFTIILQERLRYKRKFFREPLFNYTMNAVDILSRLDVEDISYILCKDSLREAVNFLLEDAQIFHGMTDSKASDALQELALLCTVFYGEKEYQDLCKQIASLRASYPVPEYGQSDVPTYFLDREEEVEII